MTESRIFEILFEYKKNENYTYDFPKLQPEAADLIAEKFTDIICETLKQKSTASHVKRGNILKYINFTCRERDCHLTDESFECFFKPLRNSLQSNQDRDVSQLIEDIQTELETDVPRNLTDKMVEFYRRKNAKQKEKVTKLEFINKINQDRLESKINLQVRRNISRYEISDNTIRDLVNSSAIVPAKLSTRQLHTADYREKQVQFGYALLNLRRDLCLLETVLNRLAEYNELLPFEVNFILYLWFFEDATLDFTPVVSEKFPFVLERLILKYATDIVQLKEDIEVDEYFANLKNDKKLEKIKNTCDENMILNKTMRSLLFELYYHSTCNENVLKLIEFI